MSEQIGHTLRGTAWGSEGAAAYATNRHGPDGDRLLDPHFLPFISGLHGEVIADIGSGAGHWSIHAAKNGTGLVVAFDIQAAMVGQSKTAVDSAEISDDTRRKIHLVQADAASIPLEGETFDRAISINVGCNLPQNGFEAHFTEALRILRPGGLFLVTAPTSFERVFTDGSVSEPEAIERIHARLAEIPDHRDVASVIDSLKTLANVYRATFAWSDQERRERLELVTDPCTLQPGQDILRKLPGLVVPNRYHAEDEYLKSALRAGFELVNNVKDHFKDREELDRYNMNALPNKQLGEEYVAASPFIVYTFRRP